MVDRGTVTVTWIGDSSSGMGRETTIYRLGGRRSCGVEGSWQRERSREMVCEVDSGISSSSGDGYIAERRSIVESWVSSRAIGSCWVLGLDMVGSEVVYGFVSLSFLSFFLWHVTIWVIGELSAGLGIVLRLFRFAFLHLGIRR